MNLINIFKIKNIIKVFMLILITGNTYAACDNNYQNGFYFLWCASNDNVNDCSTSLTYQGSVLYTQNYVTAFKDFTLPDGTVITPSIRDMGQGTGTYYVNLCVSAPVVQQPTYQYTGIENNTLVCPSTTPNGSWVQSRTYEVWSDGSVRNYSQWYNSTYTCSAGVKSIETEYRNLSCSSGQTGNIQQKRTYEIWTDGSKRNYSSWSVSSNNCVVNSITANPNRKELCDVGYTGYKEYHWVIKYRNVDYISKDADQNDIKYTVSTPYQEEELKSNTCSLIPTQGTESKDGVQEETCDSYNGSPSGTYSGSIYKYGKYESVYNSNTKQTETVFKISNTDISNCVAQIDSVEQETKIENCPSNQTGTITYYVIKAKDSQGNITYPYGDEWLLLNNNCATTDISEDNTSQETDTPNGLLTNISITSSSIKDYDSLSAYLNLLSTQSWSSNQQHKLTINIDNIENGNYDSTKVGAVISRFKLLVGSDNAIINIVLPKTIEKYIGIDEITSEKVNDKKINIKNVTFDGENAVLNYFEINDEKLKTPIIRTAKIKIVPENIGIK